MLARVFINASTNYAYGRVLQDDFSVRVSHRLRSIRCSSSCRFLFGSLRGRRAWQSSRTRGRLTRPRGLTSASDLTRNSLPLPGSLVSPAFLFQNFPLSRHGRRLRRVSRHCARLLVFLAGNRFIGLDKSNTLNMKICI